MSSVLGKTAIGGSMRELILCLLAVTLLQVACASALPEGVESRGTNALQAPATGATPSPGGLNVPHLGTEVVLDGLSILFGIALIALCYLLGRDDHSYSRNGLACLSGATLGLALGTLISPYTEGEAQQFSSLLQAGSAFVSGYLLSKLDPLIERYLKRDNLPDVSTMQRIALFATSLALTTTVVFVNRQYDRGTLTQFIEMQAAKKMAAHATLTPQPPGAVH
jgi:hypothetical protein